ncbi:hypothetical protein DMENIID0001_144640 [Sergentomyia squamirostris]
MKIYVNFHFNNDIKFVKVQANCDGELCYADFIEKARQVFNIDSPSIYFVNGNDTKLDDDEIFSEFVKDFMDYPDGIVLKIHTVEYNAECVTSGIALKDSSLSKIHDLQLGTPPASTSNQSSVEELRKQGTPILMSEPVLIERFAECEEVSQDDSQLIFVEKTVPERSGKEIAGPSSSRYFQIGDIVSIAQDNEVPKTHGDGAKNNNIRAVQNQQNDASANDKSTVIIQLKDLKTHITAILGEGIFTQKSGGLSEKERTDVIYAAALLITRQCGYWPTSYQKLCTANLLENLFPDLKADTLYDVKCTKGSKGKLDQKIRLLTRNYSTRNNIYKNKRKTKDASSADAPEKKRSNTETDSSYNKRKLKTLPLNAENNDNLTEEQATSNIEFLKNASVIYQKDKIYEVFRENLAHRRENLLTVVDDYRTVLTFFPDLISYDFDQKYGSCNEAMNKWDELCIDQVYHNRRSTKEIANQAVIMNEWCQPVSKALKLLSFFRPVNVDKSCQKSSMAEALSHLVDFFPVGTPPSAIISKVCERTTQPQLCAVGPNKKAIRDFFFVIDGYIFPAYEIRNMERKEEKRQIQWTKRSGQGPSKTPKHNCRGKF